MTPARAPAGPPRGRGILRHYTVKPTLRRHLREVVFASPGYAFASFVHLLALVLLSFWTIAEAIEERARRPIEVRLAAASDVVLAVPEPTRRESLDALAPPDPEQVLQAAPETDTDDPYQEALGGSAGHMVESARAFGLGSSGGFGRGGSRGGRGGPSTASEGALRSGLDWLARHQSGSGGWDEPGRGCGARRCQVASDGQVAHTALALLCFLCADHGPEKAGRYQALVKRAIAWLADRVDRHGQFDGAFQGYHQGIGTLALAEALARQRTPELERVVARAAKCLEDAQHPAGGWRYRPREAADTSVTSWVALGLKSAEHAGVPVDPSTWRTLERYVDAVSYQDGTTGYLAGNSGTIAMGASGFFMRLMLGEDPKTPRNRAATKLLERFGRSLRDDGGWDMYAVYYTALAMYQVGGEPWRELNPRIRDGLVAAQRTQGCERGAWVWSGHLLGTTFSMLTLETYYRYLPVHGDGDDAEGVQPALGEVSPGQRRLTEATWALEQALKHQDTGLVLAAEAAFEGAVEALEAEADSQNAALIAEARARLVQCVALQADPERTLARADEYLARLPAGMKPQLAVLRVRRGELVRRAIEAARAAAAPGASDAALERADAALKAAEQALGAERAALADADPAQAQEVAKAAQALETVRLHLGFALAPDRQIDEARASFTGPPLGPLDQAERLAVEGALDRAVRTFALVARGELPAASLARAEDDLTWAQRRAPLGRATAEVAARLHTTLERAAFSRVLALLALQRDADAAGAARAFAATYPRSRWLADVEAAERAALSRRVEAAVATDLERERLLSLLIAWSKAAPADEATTPWLDVGELLLACGGADDADRCFERALRDPALPREASERARLHRARFARAKGRLEAAEAFLAGLDRDQANVRLEACGLLRDRGRAREALEGYHVVLRGLEAERPAAWWEAAIAAAECYVELGEVAQARRFLDELRRTDPTFGGDEPRRRRIIDLMVRLDAMR